MHRAGKLLAWAVLWLLVVCAAVAAGCAHPELTQVKRSEAPADTLPAYAICAWTERKALCEPKDI